mmetsp:Transcript_29424/g.66289  ORF Transcript_29424/g.66289 Transcript_29424/m.66289 type:complete len:233 (-) Transcript_29424:158-856(-)
MQLPAPGKSESAGMSHWRSPSRPSQDGHSHGEGTCFPPAFSMACAAPVLPFVVAQAHGEAPPFEGRATSAPAQASKEIASAAFWHAARKTDVWPYSFAAFMLTPAWNSANKRTVSPAAAALCSSAVRSCWESPKRANAASRGCVARNLCALAIFGTTSTGTSVSGSFRNSSSMACFRSSGDQACQLSTSDSCACPCAATLDAATDAQAATPGATTFFRESQFRQDRRRAKLR